MGHLYRCGVILAFMVGIFGCSQNPASFKANSEPDGFAGIKWGTQFLDVKSDMVESRSDIDPAEPGVKVKTYYTRKADTVRMGEAQLDMIEYVFWQGKLAEVRLTATGPENFAALKKVLFERYGTVGAPVEGAYPWDGSVTHMVLRYDERTKTSLLLIASVTLMKQELRWLLDKDKG